MISIDVEDAEALCQLVSENLQYDSESDHDFWEAILNRLNQALTQKQ